MRTYNICGDKGCCPIVEVDQNETRIGEEGNICTLNKVEWETLKTKIRSGEIE